jgi:hypothetical protein
MISITDPKQRLANIHSNKYIYYLLRLQFDDIDLDINEYVAMSDVDAKFVARFYKTV